MRFVKLNENFLKHYNEKTNSQFKANGLAICSDGELYFIPITNSQKQRFKTYDPRNSLIHKLYDKDSCVGILKIVDYLICGSNTTCLNLDEDLFLKKQFNIMKRDAKKIEFKLSSEIKRSKNKLDLEKKVYRDFLAKNNELTRIKAVKSINEILVTISKFEGISMHESLIDELYKFSSNAKNTNLEDFRILIYTKNAWEYMLDNIDQNITLDYIIEINKICAKDQALYVGKLRDSKGGYVVGSSYEPNIPKTRDVEKIIANKVIYNNDKIDSAIFMFCYIAKEQLFFDGNKRTGIIIANHILIQNGIGVMKISEHDFDEFTLLLNKYYNHGHIDSAHYSKLSAFIITNCINA